MYEYDTDTIHDNMMLCWRFGGRYSELSFCEDQVLDFLPIGLDTLIVRSFLCHDDTQLCDKDAFSWNEDDSTVVSR